MPDSDFVNTTFTSSVAEFSSHLASDEHVFDADGHPAGGKTWGIGIDIEWQDGPLAALGYVTQPNGAFVEGVIEAAMGRLEFYQMSPFACDENAEAIMALGAALEALNRRTADREERGVEGTHAL